MSLKSIRVKSSIPVFILAMTFILALFMFDRLIVMEETALEEQSGRFQSAISSVLKADSNLYQAKVAELNLLSQIGDVPTQHKIHTNKVEEATARIEEYLEHMSVNPQIQKDFGDLNTQLKAWHQATNKLIESGKYDPNYQALETEAEKLFDHIRTRLKMAGDQAIATAQASREKVLSDVLEFGNFTFAILAVACLIVIFISYTMPKRLTQNINSLTQRIREIAEGDGDLTARIEPNSNDEIGDLAHEFNNFVDKLQKLIATVQTQSVALGSVTGHLIESAKQTESITQALGHASDSTVNAGHEMNNSNLEMASMAEETSSEARHSDEMTHQGINAVKASHTAINELVTDIDGALNQSQLLEQSSENIANVLEVIRTIAEQTNLLALNAAIEAARAGEQGRGFAVVADEVRTLATRTQDSTNDIQDMIEQLKSNVGHASSAIIRSKERADETVSHIDQVNTIFTELQESFAKVQKMSSQTAKATQEQSNVSNMISQSMSSLNEQTNAAKNVVDASRKQADEVDHLYQALDQVVGRFKV